MVDFLRMEPLLPGVPILAPSPLSTVAFLRATVAIQLLPIETKCFRDILRLCYIKDFLPFSLPLAL